MRLQKFSTYKVKYGLVFLFLPFAGTAQKIKSSAADAATKRWRIESHPVTLMAGAKGKMDFALRSVGDSCKLRLSGSGAGANTVIADDLLIFLLDNDSTFAVKSPTVQGIESGRNGNAYAHDYNLSVNELEVLSRHSLQGLRKYSADGYDDVFPDKEAAAKVKELSALFLNEMVKSAVIRPRTPAVPPAFPGGRDVLLSFFNRNVKTLSGLQTGERKFAVVQFAVTADGRVEDLQIKHSAGIVYDDELLRILKRMPKWKPAVDDGKAVAAIVTQPLTFLRSEGKMSIRF